MIKTLRIESETFFSEKEAMVVTNTPVKKGDKDKHRAKGDHSPHWGVTVMAASSLASMEKS